MHDWQIEFFGHDLDLDSCEALLHTRWPEKELKLEPELFGKKWWDYRHLHPAHATYLFAHLFVEEVRAIILKHIDNTPPRVLTNGQTAGYNPLPRDIFAPPASTAKMRAWKGKVTSIIRARQFADQYGIPYRFFIKKALHHYFFGRFYVLQENRKLPTPDLLNNQDCRIAVAEAWIEEYNSRIQYATHPVYMVTSESQHHDVMAHQAYILDQIARKADPIPSLAKFFKLKLITPEAAQARFGEQKVKRALAG